MRIKTWKFFLSSVTLSLPILGLISCGPSNHKREQDYQNIKQIVEKFGERQKTKNSNFYPNEWKVKDFKTAKQLGIKEPGNLEIIDRIIYKIEKIDLDNGSIDLSIRISKNNRYIDFNLNLYGFQTTKQNARSIIDKITKEFEKIQTTTVNIYPDKWSVGQPVEPKDLGIKEPEKNGAQIIYKIISVNLQEGIVKVKAEITKNGEEGCIEEIEIKNFITSNQKNQEDVDKVLEMLKQGLETNHTNILPSHLKINEQSINNKALGIKDFNTWQLKGVNVDLTNPEFDDENGEITVNAKVWKDKIVANTTLKISGFLTNDGLYNNICNYINKFNDKNAVDLQNQVAVDAKVQKLLEILKEKIINEFGTLVEPMIEFDSFEKERILWGDENLNEIFSKKVQFIYKYKVNGEEKSKNDAYFNVFFKNVFFNDEQLILVNFYKKLQNLSKYFLQESSLTVTEAEKIVKDSKESQNQYFDKDQILEILKLKDPSIFDSDNKINFKAKVTGDARWVESSYEYILFLEIEVSIGNLKLTIINFGIGIEKKQT